MGEGSDEESKQLYNHDIDVEVFGLAVVRDRYVLNRPPGIQRLAQCECRTKFSPCKPIIPRITRYGNNNNDTA